MDATKKKKQELVVTYPGSIKRIFEKLEDVVVNEGERVDCLYNMLSKANFPKETRYRWSYSDLEDEPRSTTFEILLSTGEIFSGIAIQRPGDKDDAVGAVMAAAGRALAVYRHNRRVFMGVDFAFGNVPVIKGIEEAKRHMEKLMTLPPYFTSGNVVFDKRGIEETVTGTLRRNI